MEGRRCWLHNSSLVVIRQEAREVVPVDLLVPLVLVVPISGHHPEWPVLPAALALPRRPEPGKL